MLLRVWVAVCVAAVNDWLGSHQPSHERGEVDPLLGEHGRHLEGVGHVRLSRLAELPGGATGKKNEISIGGSVGTPGPNRAREAGAAPVLCAPEWLWQGGRDAMRRAQECAEATHASRAGWRHFQPADLPAVVS